MTMQFTSMAPGGVREFCAGLPDASAAASRIEQDIVDGTVRPGWCWTARDGGRVLARHHWWGPTGPLVLVPDSAEDPDVAVALVVHARDAIDVREAWAEITLPGADGDPWRQRPDRVALLEGAGFTFSVDRVRIEWTGGPSHVPSAPNRLSFVSAGALEDAEMLALFASVGDASLDHGMQTERVTLGREGEAERRLAFLRGYPGIDDRLYAAVDGDGAHVGYVAAAMSDGLGVVAEIGVAASHRGRRHVDDLLTKALSTLTALGATRVVADTDMANVPMRAAFARAGFREFARRWDWAWHRAS